MIPRTFHRIWWSDGPRLPEVFDGFWQTWADHHPGWELRDWDEDKLPTLINQDLYDRAGELAPGFEGQLRSDVARLEILYQHGGVYVDADFECYRSIEPLLGGVGCFAAWEIQDQVVNNAIVGCSPGDGFIGHLIERLPASLMAHAGQRPAKMSGPWFFTRERDLRLQVFPREHFYAIGCKELDRLSEPPHPAEYARHHWNNQQRLRRRRRI